MKTRTETPSLENIGHSHHHLLCWKATLAGVLISVMAYFVLAALGAGVAGLSAQSVIEHEHGGMALATGAGLWLGLSAVISLFCGSYFTLRISRFVTNKVGAAHGFVVASVFFILMVVVAGSAVSGLSMGLGKLVAGVGQGTATLSSNPLVQDSINRALSNTTLKAPPAEVAQGLAVRLLQGDTASAKSYYAYETGSTEVQVDQKVAQLESDFNRAAKDAGEKAAAGVADAGWSLFVTFVVGLIAAVMGGRIGAQANTERPFAVTESEGYVSVIPATI